MAWPVAGTFDWDTDLKGYIDAGAAGSPAKTVFVSSASALQAAIDAITPFTNAEPDIYVTAPFTATTAIACGTKRFRLRGLGAQNYNDPESGTVIKTGTDGMNLFTIDAGAGLNFQGPTFENIHFYDEATSSTLFYVDNTDRVTWRDCTFGGAIASDGGTAVSFQFDGANDCSWHRFDECQFNRLATGVKAITGYGFTMVGGATIGCTIPVDIRPPFSHARVYGTKFDGINAITCLGSFNTFSDIHWECGDASASVITGILFDGDGSTTNSGYYNTVNGAALIGAGGTNTTGMKITAAAQRSTALGVGGVSCPLGTIVNLSTTSSFHRLGEPSFGQPYMDFGTAGLFSHTGSPEGAVTANIGSLYLRKDGGATTTLYVKTSGTGNTGWTAK